MDTTATTELVQQASDNAQQAQQRARDAAGRFVSASWVTLEDQQQAQQPAQDGQPTTPTTPTTAQQTQQPAQSTPTTPATTQQPVQPDPQEVFAKQYDERIAEVYKEADAELTQISDEYVGYVREVADSAEQFYATIADLEVDAQAYKQQADATYQAARSILTRIAGMIQQSGGTMDVSAISLLAQELDLSYQRSGMAKHALQMQKQQELQAQRAQRAQTVQQELARFQQQRDPQKRAQARQVANIERNTQAKFTAAGLSAFDYQEARAGYIARAQRGEKLNFDAFMQERIKQLSGIKNAQTKAQQTQQQAQANKQTPQPVRQTGAPTEPPPATPANASMGDVFRAHLNRAKTRQPQ